MAGRKPLSEPALVVRAVITLRPGEDDDLIRAFQGIPARKRAAFIKAAMRSGNLQAISSDDLPSDDELAESIADFLE